MNSEQFVKFLAEELKQEIATIQTALDKYYASQPLVFSTKKVKDAYDDAIANNKLKTEIKIGTGSNGKVTMDDIRKATGELAKGQKAPSEWVSTAAKELADENNLNVEDFTENDRSGKPTKAPLASGLTHRIAIEDVRKKILIAAEANGEDVSQLKEKFYSSPGVAELANENGLSPTDFDVKGEKITKKMVEDKIKQLATSGGDSEEEDDE